MLVVERGGFHGDQYTWVSFSLGDLDSLTELRSQDVCDNGAQDSVRPRDILQTLDVFPRVFRSHQLICGSCVQVQNQQQSGKSGDAEEQENSPP